MRNLELGLHRAAAGDNLAILDGVLDNTGSIIDRPLEFVYQQLGVPPQEYRDRLRVFRHPEMTVSSVSGSSLVASARPSVYLVEFLWFVDDGAGRSALAANFMSFLLHVFDGVDTMLGQRSTAQHQRSLSGRGRRSPRRRRSFQQVSGGTPRLLLGERLHLFGGGWILIFDFTWVFVILQRLGEPGQTFASLTSVWPHLLEGSASSR